MGVAASTDGLGLTGDQRPVRVSSWCGTCLSSRNARFGRREYPPVRGNGRWRDAWSSWAQPFHGHGV